MSETTPTWQAENHRYDAKVDNPLPERDWPTWQSVVERFPDLCMEEHQMILEGLIDEAHKRRQRCEQ